MPTSIGFKDVFAVLIGLKSIQSRSLKTFLVVGLVNIGMSPVVIVVFDVASSSTGYELTDVYPTP